MGEIGEGGGLTSQGGGVSSCKWWCNDWDWDKMRPRVFTIMVLAVWRGQD